MLHLKEIASFSVALLDLYSLDLTHQCVWRIKNGNQTQGRWCVKEILNRVNIYDASFPVHTNEW